MARQTSSSDPKPTPRTSTRSAEERPASRGTGQEPDPRGVHRPGKAPGEFTDLGPVTIPADAPRIT